MTIQLSPKQEAMTRAMANDHNPQVARHANTILDLYDADKLDWNTFNKHIDAAKQARGQTTHKPTAKAPAPTTSSNKPPAQTVADWQHTARHTNYTGFIPDHPDYYYTPEAIRLDLAAKHKGYNDHNAYAYAYAQSLQPAQSDTTQDDDTF